jgi:NDP-sugar pyrophosphorylase family protein
MQALILAGGEGARLRPLTIHTPKPIVPLANRPFLYYQLDLLKQAGIKDITLSLSYQPSKIESVFGDGEELGLNICYVVEATPMGTAGAYKYSQERLDQTTIVFNGDILTDINVSEIIAYHREKKAVATIALATVENPSAYGLVETDSDGRALRFIEKPKAEEITCDTINAGIYVLEPEVLNYIPAGEKFSFEYQLFPALLAANERLYARAWPGYWIDIGAPQRYLQANKDLINGRLKSFDVTRSALMLNEADAATIKIDGRSVIDPTCSLKSGVEITNSVLGPKCVIEERARIENSVLLAGARVGKAAEISGSVVGKSCLIGRNSKVTNATLGDKSSLTDYTIV